MDDLILPCRPTAEEAIRAFWLASYAEDVVKSFIEKGRPDAGAFLSLCNSIVELKMKTIGASEFHERAEEIEEGMRENNWQPEEREL